VTSKSKTAAKSSKKKASKKNDVATPAIPIAAGGSVLRPLKAAEVVAREVVRSIRAGGLQPGDNLPSEAEMLKEYSVSRESLREALRLLEVGGMITIRRGPGGGPVVGTVDSANLGRMQALYFHLSGATYSELIDAWVFAESTLAQLAAQNADTEARQAAMAPYLDGDAEDADHADLEVYMAGHEGFHATVAALSGNRVLHLTFRSYGQLMAHHIATVGDVRRQHDVLAEDHLKIARAIHDGDSDAAAALMEAHLTQVASLNKAELGELLEGTVEWL
jgi:DNA-binding FadR family transcriptional regulator